MKLYLSTTCQSQKYPNTSINVLFVLFNRNVAYLLNNCIDQLNFSINIKIFVLCSFKPDKVLLDGVSVMGALLKLDDFIVAFVEVQ